MKLEDDAASVESRHEARAQSEVTPGLSQANLELSDNLQDLEDKMLPE
jgi:hypothetical protein